MSAKLHTDPQECEKLLEGLNQSICHSFGYQSILNEHYAPDRYLFFSDQDDLIPLVEKQGLVTFYGGTQHNYRNRLPHNAELVNECLGYLLRHRLRFQLLSIDRDPIGLLEDEFRRLDVPFQAEWHFEDLESFDPDQFVFNFSGKKRWSLKRVLRKRAEYSFESWRFDRLSDAFEDLMEAHLRYFRERGKQSVWQDQTQLLFRLLSHFHEQHQLLIRTINADAGPAATYVIASSKNEMVYFFGGSLRKGDHYVSKVMYFDMLEQASRLATQREADSLNGLRGAFGNKKSFGFTPKPLFALVQDPHWQVRRDPDVDDQQHREAYGRSFGIEGSD